MKQLTAEDMLEQIRTMHVNRRTIFRNLVLLGRLLSLATPYYLSELLRCADGAQYMNGVARRQFVALDDAGWQRTVATCNFPVGIVSAAANMIVIGRANAKGVLVLDIAELLRELLQEQHHRYRSRALLRPMASVPKTHTTFTERQRAELIERHILCQCGNLLWSPEDACCE